jgi:tetratricopeptide (TPR) repeat protein
MNGPLRIGSIAMSRLSALALIMIACLLGSLECTAQSVTADSSSPVILPANTPVILRLKESLYKKDAKPGYSLEFEVGYDVLVNGQILIRSGIAVKGSVRRVDHGGGPAKVLVDLGPAQTVSGEMARLASTGTPATGNPGIGDAVGFVDEPMALPIVLPVFAAMKLFQKKVLLDKGAGCGWFNLGGCGVWVVAHVAEDVGLDPAKQQAAQAEYAEHIEKQKAAVETQLHEFVKQLPEEKQSAAEAQLREILKQMNESSIGTGLFSASHKAQLLHQAADLDAAIEEYQRDLAWDANSSQLHLEIAGLLREKGDLAGAVSECRTAVQLSPNNERARIALTTVLTDSGDVDSALTEATEAVRMWPQRPYFHYLFGRALVKKNDPDEAIVELQWALKKEKNRFSPANCELGRAFELKGDPKAALRQYHTAIRAHGGDKECRAAYERLQLQAKK